MQLIESMRRSKSAGVIFIALAPFILFLGLPREPRFRGGGVARAEQQPVADPLLSLNDSFREAYSRCRQEFINRSGDVILVESDDLVLIHKGERSQVRFVPEPFHVLKAVSHIPLAVYVMLVELEDTPLGKENLEGLQAYRQRIAQIEPSLKDRGLTETVLQRHREIIQASLVFLDSVLEKKLVKRDELGNFTREIGPKLLVSAADATQIELDALDKQVTAWRATLSEGEWKRLHVVIMGSAMPRRGNLAIQYFAQLLGEKGEGKRIVYAEALFDEKRASNLLGTHLLDTRIGVDFFDDPERMHRDLLADAAAEYLKKMAAKP
jgi:hypothetical protein